ncbi:FAD:protein FMN transferase [Amycolatopsis magusensis]|uniref:FAD:protein FMN transferase n=1 Tax=Amycolatopsis magusensis TaxID=882444 RepID=UPI00379E0599
MPVFSFDAIGTRWEIETPRPLAADVHREVLDRIQRFDLTYSRFRANSLVSRIAAAENGGRFEFPADAVGLFGLYDRFAAATSGAVDPLVGRDLELLGYDSGYSLVPAAPAVWQRERARGRARWTADVIRDGTTLITRRPVVIDVGAVGKGYLVDLVSEILRSAGVDSFVVDAGGDLRHAGDSGIRVGLEHPTETGLVAGVAELRNHALCASAVNRRAWGPGLHHVVDGRTGLPVDEVIATWVLADEAAIADGLATALFFTGAVRLAESFEFAHARMFADGRAEMSAGFDGELFVAEAIEQERK